MNDEAIQRRLSVRAFGSLGISDATGTRGAADLGGVRPKQVLQILIAARGRRVPVDRIAELLWGNDMPETPTNSLQTFVSLLRRRLTDDREYARRLVVTEREAYRFATDLVDLDLDRFDRLIERSAGESTHAARRSLEQALTLVGGDIFEDEPYATYALDLRASYQGRILGARLDTAEAALAERDFVGALNHAEAAVALDRFSERARRAEMLSLYAAGRGHEALSRYRSFRIALDTELGLEPSAESRSLEGSLIRQEDAEGLLPRPISRDATQTRSRRMRLLGRSEELKALQAGINAALAGSSSLIRVEGDAGLGKTRLLEEAAESLPAARLGRATCSRLERHLPYVPLASALRSAFCDVDLESLDVPPLQEVLPELALRTSGPPFEEVEVLESIVAMLTAHAPIVLMIDDLHNADRATVAALSYLRRRTAPNAVAIVFTSRETSECARHVEADAVVQLDALTAEDLAPFNVPNLYELTGGNPRIVVEALSTEQQRTRSHSLAEALRAQCAAEGEFAYRLLTTAAVLEQPFFPELLAATVRASAADVIDELERLCQRRLLAVDGVGFRFRYQSVREVLADEVSPARRQLITAAAFSSVPLGVGGSDS
jgi:DNA-binding SARP family transcriptional activator